MTISIDQAYEDCRRVVRRSGSSFRAGMQFLPPDRRRAIFAIYALARRIDDIADGELPTAAKLAQFARLRAELASPDPPDTSLLVAVRDAAERYPIPLGAFEDLLDGVEADVRGDTYATFPELEKYCRCVAGSIGRLCLGVFETSDRGRAEPLADDLGVALQLGQHGHVGLDQAQSAAGPGDRGELVGYPEPGQDAVDLVVEVDGAGLGVDRGPSVEDQGPYAGLGQQDRCSDARGPGTDDDHVDRRGLGRRAHQETPSATR